LQRRSRPSFSHLNRGLANWEVRLKVRAAQGFIDQDWKERTGSRGSFRRQSQPAETIVSTHNKKRNTGRDGDPAGKPKKGTPEAAGDPRTNIIKVRPSKRKYSAKESPEPACCNSREKGQRPGCGVWRPAQKNKWEISLELTYVILAKLRGRGGSYA